jgi:hypothetical protein
MIRPLVQEDKMIIAYARTHCNLELIRAAKPGYFFPCFSEWRKRARQYLTIGAAQAFLSRKSGGNPLTIY